MKWNLQRN